MGFFKRKSIDEKFADIGFKKSIENDARIEYYRRNTHYTTQYLLIKRDASECNCFITTTIYKHNDNLGNLTITKLSLYETYLCIKKAKAKGWRLKL